MNEIEIFIRFSFLGLSTLLSIISFISIIKIKELKLAFASISFLLFTIIGIIVSVGVFLPAIEHFNTTSVLVGILFISLIFFYLSILKR